MQTRKFGNSDLEISALGFGGWPMGGTQYGTTDDSEAMGAVARAIEVGITCFDNAAGYGLGHSEELMGKALAPYRKDIVLVTKCGLSWDSARKRLYRDSTKEAVIKGCEDSLRRLGTDYIDLMLVHWPDPESPFEETMSALSDLRDQGKIRYAGVSNFMPAMMEESLRHLDIVADQAGYSIFERRIERDVQTFCLDNGIGLMAYGSLAHGLLSGAMTTDTQFESWDWRATQNAFGMPLFRPGFFEDNVRTAEQLGAVADAAGMSLPDLAAAWVLTRPTVTTALVGFRTAAEVDAAVRAADTELPGDLLARVNAISDEAYARNAGGEDLSPKTGTWNPWDPNPKRFGSTSR
jgi:aryl-alcohol dehydrogenase-like predicted oxidoreductase